MIFDEILKLILIKTGEDQKNSVQKMFYRFDDIITEVTQEGSILN